MGEAKGHQTGEKIVLELNSGSRLETGKGRWSTIPKRINFRKSSEGGGGISNPKNFIADFCHYRRYLGHEFQKKLQYDFPKMRGGIKGRSELFQKFIRFGDARLPL